MPEEAAEAETRPDDNNASPDTVEESAEDVAPAEKVADEDDTSSKLHFEMSAEDIEMLEAQLRELSAPTPSPVPPSAPAELDEDEIQEHELVKTPLPEETEIAQTELNPVDEICSGAKESDEELHVDQGGDENAPLPPENSLEPEVPKEV